MISWKTNQLRLFSRNSCSLKAAVIKLDLDHYIMLIQSCRKKYAYFYLGKALKIDAIGRNRLTNIKKVNFCKKLYMQDVT